MDTQARSEAAKARLSQGRDYLESVRRVGPPCTGCKHYARTPLTQKAEFGRCRHPVFTVHAFVVAAGELRSHHVTSVKDARADLGECGPEAILYERKSWFFRLLEYL
jgi:hypothetical protein